MALALGMTVRELEDRMEHRELVHWMTYFTIEPWGPVQEDYRAGVIATTIARCHGNKVEPSGFFPSYSQRAKGLQTQEDQIAIFKRLAAIQQQ